MAVKADSASKVPAVEIPGEGTYLTDGKVLLRVLGYIERLDEIRVEDCLTGDVVVIVGDDMRKALHEQSLQVVIPEPKADDGD